MSSGKYEFLSGEGFLSIGYKGLINLGYEDKGESL